ncbi:MAG: hypothetical protein MUP14_07840 [Dehalococcoidia bacterium]|nr:hypothetical protein [Dehalococcoidia bacterium]
MSEFRLARAATFHDGLSIEKGTVTIHQKGFKGDITIQARDITEVRASRSQGDIPFLQGSINLRVGTKKYVLRRLPKGKRDAALVALRRVMVASD